MSSSSPRNRIDVAIGERIAGIRDERNQTQETVAEILGLSLEDYVAREEGRARFFAAHLFELAQHFHVTISEFFDRIDTGS